MKNSNENRNPRVLDTSALVHDPKSLLAYRDDIYVCLTVLEELDNLKERTDKNVSQDARAVIRMLEDIINGHSSEEMEKGIELPSTETAKRGKLFIGIDTQIDFAKELKKHKVENFKSWLYSVSKNYCSYVVLVMILLPKVTSSAYSNSPPMGIPRAIEVIFTSNSFNFLVI